jgi:outer membrane protein assembly factor BamB
MRQRSSLATALVLAVCGPLAAGDWSSFRGDSALSGVATDALEVPLTPVWTFSIDLGSESSPAIAGGRVYVTGLDAKLHALDLESGEPLWFYDAVDEIKSSPSVAGDSVYFGDESGTFHAVDAATGAARWTFATEGGIISSANRVGDLVLFGSYDQYLYALHAADGRLAWKV